ncbi:MAG: hypothetical protein E5Y09_31240, partial [Mesorhizobium sp.]
GQWAVGSGQWAVGSGQWAVGSGQWARRGHSKGHSPIPLLPYSSFSANSRNASGTDRDCPSVTEA